METKWLEDFVSLAETGSFSKSAQARNVTQPAFSRRIQSLESWLGVDLIDRGSYPTKLTSAGATFYSQSLEMLEQIGAARSMARGTTKNAAQTIDVAVPHTLSLIYFPGWWHQQQQALGLMPCRLVAANVHDAALRLVEGGCDLLMCYHHPEHPVQLDPTKYELKVLGADRLLPYVKPGLPDLLPVKANASVRYLSYSPGAYLRRMADLLVERQGLKAKLTRVYETDMAEGLKVMALQGHGIAFLPESSVERELVDGRLCLALSPKERKRLDAWSVPLEIRLFREKPSKTRPGKPSVNKLWNHLEST